MLKTLKYFVSSILLLVVILALPVIYQTYIFLNTDFISFPTKTSNIGQSEVYLIGSRHQPTSSYNADTLYQQLEKIQPDIILLEWDSSFFKKQRIKWWYRQIIPSYYREVNSLELLAATKYSRNHENVILAPFEWDSTSVIFNEIQGKPRAKMMRALFNTNSDTSNQVLKECGALRSYTLNLPNLSSFNTDMNDSLMERFIKLEYQVVPSLILMNDSLKEYHPIAEKFRNYWPNRNLHMSNNILQIIKSNPNNKIAVLTGFRHRYFLRKYLSEQFINHNFKLLDYNTRDITIK